MQDYLTISEFAKLRNINVSSLRYYEKVGIFKPAKVDKANGYRYYSIEQLSELDFILLSIDLGIPIKDLPQFWDADGNLHTRNLMECGREQLLGKLKEYEQKLSRLDRALEYMDANRPFTHKDGFYKKHISAREILTESVFADRPVGMERERALASIYKKAAKAKLSPLFPVGLLVDRPAGRLRTYMFTSVVGDSSGADDLMLLPEGEYLCTQVGVKPDMNIIDDIENRFGIINDTPVIVEHIFYEVDSAEFSRSEIQKLIN